MKIIEEILKKEKISFTKIKEQNNHFVIDDVLLVKLALNKNDITGLENETDVLKNCKSPFLPQLIKTGKCKKVYYEILKNINAKPLLHDWAKYKKDEKEKIIKKFAENLAKIHKNNSIFLQKQFCDTDWQKHWHTEFDKIISLFEKFKLNTVDLKNFTLFNLDKIFMNNTYALIHNNLSLENIFVFNDDVFICDFEKARFCAIDYELNNLTINLKNLLKESDKEDKIKFKLSNEDVSFFVEKLKEFYPDIFADEQIENRLWIYNFYSNIKYALKNDEPELIEFELESFNNFYKNFELPNRSLEQNIIFEINELCNLYQKDSNVNMFKQILDAVDFGRKFALNLGADAKIVAMSCVLFNQAILTQEGSFLQYHITSAELCNKILEKYKCDDKTKNRIMSCVLNHKSIENATNIEEKCVAMAVSCSIFKNLFNYCKNVLYINPKTKFNDLKEEMSQKYNELDNMAKQFVNIDLEKQLNKVYKKLFKNK